MGFVILQKISVHVQWQNNKIFNKFISSSMPMYLFHQQIIYFTIYWLNGKVDPYINVCINFVLAIFGSFVISNIFLKFKMT